MPRASAPMAPDMLEEYPEVIDAVRFTQESRVEVRYGDRQFFEENIFYADNSVFTVFTFPMIAGDPKTALESAYTVVITEDMARKYFGDEEPLGQILKVNGNYDFTVTGVIENVPTNSHFTFDILLSYETLADTNPAMMTMWGQIGNSFSYLLLDEHSDYRALEKKFPALIDKNSGDVLRRAGATLDLFLQPLKSIFPFS